MEDDVNSVDVLKEVCFFYQLSKHAPVSAKENSSIQRDNITLPCKIGHNQIERMQIRRSRRLPLATHVQPWIEHYKERAKEEGGTVKLLLLMTSICVEYGLIPWKIRYGRNGPIITRCNLNVSDISALLKDFLPFKG